ncbi:MULTISPECIES: DUF2933 domain-containing protein [Sphingomonadaceae]|uniref:DUF2933 domain-containing protein n=1 Tax=Sphingomonadales TaxID=204457 RepID=UPI0009FFE831
MGTHLRRPPYALFLTGPLIHLFMRHNHHHRHGAAAVAEAGFSDTQLKPWAGNAQEPNDRGDHPHEIAAFE